MPRYLFKCGCCDQQVEIYYANDSLEINGVIASIENWREVLLPLLYPDQPSPQVSLSEGRFSMKVMIRLSAREELKALPILLRHSPGMGLPNRTYVISTEAARALREAGVRFTELASEVNPPSVEGAESGERI
ncbi:MAG TPA: hypothetical protein VH682_28080 [Gemmataceae bacterium]|jgi:hypothetical protein